ncbi:hypothetical protein EJ110_NYTH41095 [Nymphaea thermarum]|nr:hypothetical protein EJ110_NYTH41095 [Nymphaea thermarum]
MLDGRAGVDGSCLKLTGISTFSFVSFVLIRLKRGIATRQTDERLDYKIHMQRIIPKEVQKILHTLASQWEDVVDDKKLHVEHEVFQCLWVSKKEVVHRRIYGEGVDVFFDREDKIRTFKCMPKNGQGPRLLGHFPAGLIKNNMVECLIEIRYIYIPTKDEMNSYA